MDIKTILICLFIINLYLGFFTFVIRKTQLTFPGIKYWIASHFLIASGYMLLSLGGKIPDFFSVILSRTFFIIGCFIRIFGIQKFFQKEITRAHKLLSGIVFFIFEFLIIFFTYTDANLSKIIATTGFFISGMAVIAGIQILRNKSAGNRTLHFFTAMVFFIFAGIFLSRVTGSVLFPKNKNLFASTFLNNLQFMSTMLIDITWTIMFFVIYNQRLTFQLRKLNSTKDRFFSILAHDLRTPFNSILGFSKLILAKLRTEKVSTIEDHLHIVQTMARQTYKLLEEILIWAKCQSGDILYAPKRVHFPTICREIVENLKLLTIEKNITIHYRLNDSTYLLADENMLKTILRNLISNGIKFTNANGAVTISSNLEGTLAIITVSDTGVGIDQKNIKKLWEITTHYSTTGTANEKGTGFGLILCKEFVELHGGKIWVESEPGKGSNFKFIMPLSRSKKNSPENSDK